MQQLYIYRSSAGSGKTHILALTYVVLALRRADAFRHILAITFTRKATAEMKRRVLSFLVQLAADSNPDLRAQVAQRVPEHIDIPTRARDVLHNILHHYSYLGVQTMESFFYQVVRAFEHELRLQLGEQLELDAKTYMKEAAERVLNEAGTEPGITQWLSQMVQSRMDDAKNYELMQELSAMGHRVLLDGRNHDMLARLQETDVLGATTTLVRSLQAQRKQIEATVQRMAAQLMNAIQNEGYAVSDFAYGQGGVVGFVDGLAGGDLRGPTKRATEAKTSPEAWLSKTTRDKKPQLVARVTQAYMPQLHALLGYLDEHLPQHAAAQAVLKNLYMLPLLARMQHHLRAIRAEQGVLFMADVADLLQAVIAGSTAPFVYEKIGVRYHHFLLDEFQDTARQQWHNLRPLVANNMAQGMGSLVVGDAKQSIYRWRGGQANLLLQLQNDSELQPHRDSVHEVVLAVNRRSGQYIVDFSNRLFQAAGQVLQQALGSATDAAKVTEAYAGADAVQEWLPNAANSGYVCFAGVESDKETPFKEQVLARTGLLVQALLQQGYRYADIAILTRNNSETKNIAEFLLGPGYHYPIASAEALSLSSSPRVAFLIALFERLCYPHHAIAEAQLRLALQRMLQLPTAPTHTEQHNQPELTTALATLLQARTQLLRLSLPELCNELLLRLHPYLLPDAYVLRFQDVLLAYAHKEGGQLLAFLAWWAQHGPESKLIATTGDAIQILTIHKAKGLEYPVVILPFCDWGLRPKENHQDPNLLWVQNVPPPYDVLPVLPLAAKSKTEPTDVFYTAYHQEVLSSYQDNLNLLYVATTRARERLYGFYPLPKDPKEDSLLTVAQLLTACWQQAPLAQYFDAGQHQLQLGQQATPTATHVPATPSLPLQAVRAAWQQRLVIRPRAGQFEQLLNARLQQQQAFGEVLHQVLAAIRNLGDSAHALAQVHYAGLLPAADAAQLTLQVQGLLALPAMRAWLDGTWNHLTEATLLHAGKVLRPDRVVVRDKEAVVLDYKTGQPKPAHVVQVQGYMHALRDMGYNASGYLLYTEQAHLQAVEIV